MNKISEVRRQLGTIDKYTLLFLDKVTDLTVFVEDKVTIFNRQSEDDQVIIVEEDEQFSFKTFRKTGKIDSKGYEIVIAYDEKIVPGENKLYSFFETNIDFPIKWKCHVTFELESNRNGIKKSDENLQLLTELANFVCKEASELNFNNRYPYYAFDSLLKSSDFPSGLNIKGKNFNDIFEEVLKKAKVSPTFSNEKVPFFFRYIDAGNILLESKDEQRNRIIKNYSSTFEDMTLSNIISEKALDWTTEQKVSAFLWWEDIFSESPLLPELMENCYGDIVTAQSNVYFIRGRELNIPSWAKINRLHPEYEDELKKQVKLIKRFVQEIEEDPNHIIERVISRNSGFTPDYEKKIILHIKFSDADASTILSPINSAVEKNYENLISYVKWLWENYSQNDNWSASEDLSFNLPNDNGNVKKSTNLFFDSKYGNNLGEKLFINQRYSPFISYEKLDIDIESIREFQRFISKLGVLEFPILEHKEITDQQFTLKFDSNYLETKLPSKETNEHSPKLIDAIYNNIHELNQILENLSIKEILEWVKKDSNLQAELDLKHAGNIKFQYIVRTKAFRTEEFLDYDNSYIQHVFQNSKWIKIDEEKYQPNQCVLAYNGLDISDLVPTITPSLIKEMA